MRKYALKYSVNTHSGSTTHYGGPYKVFWGKIFTCSGVPDQWEIYKKNQRIWILPKKRSCDCGNGRWKMVRAYEVVPQLIIEVLIMFFEKNNFGAPGHHIHGVIYT